MSKGNMFLGFARGKVGDIVFSRRMGQQITRAYVSKVNDATTRSQVLQRSLLGNVVSMYRLLRSWLVGAYESAAAGQSDYNVFASQNLASSKVYTPAGFTQAGGCVVAPYLVSRGVLPSIQVTESVQGTFMYDIALPADFVLTAATTVAEFSTAVLGSNGDWQVGDKLSLCRLTQSIDVATGFPVAHCFLHGVTLDTTSTTLLAAYIPLSWVSNIGGFLGFEDVSFTGGLFAVHSRKDAGGSIKVSTQRILLTLNNAIYANYTGQQSVNDALLTRGYKDEVFANPANQSAGSAVPLVPDEETIVTDLRFRGASFLAADSAFIGNGNTVVVRGTGLDPDDIRIVLYSGEGGTLSTLLNITTSSDTEITGTWNSVDGDVKYLFVDGILVRQWEEGIIIDPDA